VGLAKAAELNSYPGPLHVLELARELDLTDTQHARTQSLYATTRARAQFLGIKIIEAERDLDRAFTNGTISMTELRSRLNAIATLQGELRAVHLEAHLAQRSVLTPQQVANYDELRGYHGNLTEPSGHQQKEH
jgi:Spy/CpxP family protein refolding chaperone